MSYVSYPVLKTVSNMDELEAKADEMGLKDEAKWEYIRKYFILDGLIFGEPAVYDQAPQFRQSQIKS